MKLMTLMMIIIVNRAKGRVTPILRVLVHFEILPQVKLCSDDVAASTNIVYAPNSLSQKYISLMTTPEMRCRPAEWITVSID